MAEKITLDIILNNRGAITSLEDLRQAVKLANAELSTLGEGAKNYGELSSFVSAGNTEILRQQKLLKGLTSEEIAGAYARIGGGISSTFAAASAALATFGVENESVLKAAADAQNLLTIAISTRQIQEGILSARQLSNLVAERARLALSRLNKTATDAETISEVANSAALDKNTSAEVKNAAATGAKTVATEGETVATVAQTGAQGILNTVTTAGTNIMKAFYATVAANPFGAIITAIGLLVTGVIVLKNVLQDTDKAYKAFNNAVDESSGQIAVEIRQLDALVAIVKDNNRSQADRLSAYEELQKVLPGIKDLTIDQALAEEKLTQAYDLQIKVLKSKAKLDAAQQIYSKAFSEILKVQRKDIGDYAFTWQSLLSALTQGTFAFGALQAKFEDLREATDALSDADKLLNQFTIEHNNDIIAQNNFIRENTEGKVDNTRATNEQVIANNRLRDAYANLSKFLKETLDFYKELGKVVEVEDKLPEFIEKVNGALRERNKLVKQGGNAFEEGLVKIGFQTKALDSMMLGAMRMANGFLNANLKTTDSLLNLSDVFGKAIEDDYESLFLSVGNRTETFDKYIRGVREDYLKLFEEGKITPEALGSVDALIQNLTSMNRLVREGGVSLSETFNKENLNEYLEAQREVSVAEGKIGFEIDKTTGKVIQATADRKNYSKNLQTIAVFESEIYKKTVDGLEDIRRASNENFKATVIRAQEEKRITSDQAQTLLSQADVLSKSEIERTNLINRIAEQRVESVRKQVTGTQKELDRIRKYNFEFTRDIENAEEISAAAITTLIEKNTGDFLEAIERRARFAITNSQKIAQADRLLQARLLDSTKFTEEEKIRIYEATYQYQKEISDKSRKDITKNIEEFFRIAQQALNAYQEYVDRARELAIERINIEETEKLRQLEFAYSQGLVLEKTYQQKRLELIEEYTARRNAVEKKSRIKQLQLDRLQAIANVAVGVTKSIEQGGIFGLITGAIVAAAGAAEISIISQQISLAQSLKKGGWIKAQEGLMVQGPSHENGGVKFQNGGYELEGGEAVINRVSARNYQGLLSQINQSGGGRPLVSSFDDSRIVDAIAKQRMEPIRAYVIEQDITRKQAINKKLDQLSRF